MTPADSLYFKSLYSNKWSLGCYAIKNVSLMVIELMLVMKKDVSYEKRPMLSFLLNVMLSRCLFQLTHFHSINA